MQQIKKMPTVSAVGRKKAALYALATTLLGGTTLSTAAAQVSGVVKDSASRTVSALQTASIHGIAPSVVSARPKPSEITRMVVIPEEMATRIIIVGTQPFTPSIQSVAHPSATVITIDGRWNAGRKGITAIRRNGVNSIHAGQFSDTPQQVRIVANTDRVLPVRTQSSSDRTHWEIIMDAPGTVKIAPSTPPVKETPAAASVTGPAASKAVIVESKPVTAPESTLLTGFKPVAPEIAGVKTVAVGASTPAEKQVEVRSATVAAREANQPAEEARRVSLDFVAADINDVLKALSLQSGINIVTSTDVKGTVTVSMRRVSFREALDTVVNLSNYKYARVGSTYAVGSAEGVASLVRGSLVGPQVTESVPFIFSDGASLKDAIETAFPSVKGRVSLVTVGTEGRTATANSISNANGTTATVPTQGPATGAKSTSSSNVSTDRMIVDKVIPKGGVISVTGTEAEVASVKQFIDSTERALLDAPTREAEARAKENAAISARATEVYTIRYGSPIDLIAVIHRLVPSVSVQAGPAQGFQPNVLGGSASYTTGGSAAGDAIGKESTASGGSSSSGTGASNNTPANTGSGLNPSGRASNTLLLTGTLDAIARAREVLTQVDTKVQQVSFEARVVDSTMDDLRQLGFQYDFNRPVSIGERNDGNANLGSQTALQTSRDPNFGAIFRSPYSITATLDALETKGRVRTLARPNLTALDNQPAVVFIGDQIKYVISIQQTQQGQSIQTETATVGITLRVTPKTSPDGMITVYVHPEVSVISSYLNLGNGISLPQIATRFVDSTVRVKDGETFALGGLIRQQDVDNIRKVPFLGDLPFFGNLLFKNRDKERHNSEVVILITTRILKD